MGLRGILRKPLGLDKKPRVVYRDRPQQPGQYQQPRPSQPQFTRAYRGGNVINISVGQPSGGGGGYRTYNPNRPQKTHRIHGQHKKSLLGKIAHGLKVGAVEGAKAYRAESVRRRAENSRPQAAGGRPSWMNEQSGTPNWVKKKERR